jgi:DNA polymerase III sliding clamp (beta) subunit (PCNA family)
MSTIEETKVSVNYIELAGESLLELLEGASTHADKGKSALHALNSVQLEGAGGDLIARATDRYRLIEGATRYSDGGLEPSLVSLEDIKRVITLLKAHKAHLVNITRVGNAITFSALGDAITFTLVEANYPPKFDDLFAKGEPTPMDEIAFNPAYMADYSKINAKSKSNQVNPVKLQFRGANMPIHIILVGDKVEWRALLMPMRII